MFLSFQPFWMRRLEKSRYFTATNTGCNSQIPAHFTRVAAQERENWLALLQEQGQFGQNQFSQFSELTRSIYAQSEPTGQFWQMVSDLLADWPSVCLTFWLIFCFVIFKIELSPCWRSDTSSPILHLMACTAVYTPRVNLLPFDYTLLSTSTL